MPATPLRHLAAGHDAELRDRLDVLHAEGPATDRA